MYALPKKIFLRFYKKNVRSRLLNFRLIVRLHVVVDATRNVKIKIYSRREFILVTLMAFFGLSSQFQNGNYRASRKKRKNDFYGCVKTEIPA